MAHLGIIGGTGLTSMPELVIDRREMIKTRWGAPSGPVLHGMLNGVPITFLARHGRGHTIPPHRVNYRANIQALVETGVTHVVAVAAVGGIADDCVDRIIVVPDQIIDYTYGRAHTFYEAKSEKFDHIDFTTPYTEHLRQTLINGAASAGVDCVDNGVYGATQGPRLETAAEIKRMENDGCTVVGMTGMPEAALAREAGVEYACCAVVVNRAAGKGDGTPLMADIEANVKAGVENVQKVLASGLKAGFC
jgi:5'-deoxy-5'-methylthioadenosine phosphorylase